MPSLTIPATGVSQTALFIAWTRHMEAEQRRPLFTDPLAAFLLAELAGHPAMGHVGQVVEQTHVSAKGFPAYFAVRTRFFDDEVRAALNGGVRQVVTLAAGIDGRTTRLACPPGTRWFELDLPDMTEFKTALIAQSGLDTTCERIGVGVDLTTDWATPLRAAGFDPARPTLWLVEGLLMYLTPEAGNGLLASLSALSAPGSHLLLEHLRATMLGDEGTPVRQRVESQGASWLSARDDLGDWLGGLGWRARVHAGTDPAIGHGRDVAPLPACWLATAELI